MLGFFSYETAPPLATQNLAAGDPDWVLEYSWYCEVVGSDFDHGRVQLEITSSIDIDKRDNRIK